jgi:hypothetical protein
MRQEEVHRTGQHGPILGDAELGPGMTSAARKRAAALTC